MIRASPSYSRRWRRRRADFPLMVGCAVAHCVCFAAASGLGVGAGSSRGWIAGAMVAPSVYGSVGINAAAMWRINAASGQAAAKARRTREAISTNPRAELQEPQANGVELGGGERVCLGDCITDGEHEPVGGSVQDQPHLVGERITAAGAVGGELRLVQFDQVLGLASGAVERLVKILCRSGLQAGDDEADVEALGGSLDPGTGTAIGVPGFRPVACLGKAT